MPPVNWLAGWVQLWFSIAITKTVLTSCAYALKLHAAKSASVPKSRGSRIVYIFESPHSDFAGYAGVRFMPRARNPLRADNTTSSMNSNAVLLHDERRVKGCKDFVG